MRNPKVAHRYAKSLLELAAEKGQADAVENDMRLIASTIEESRDLALLLASPVVKSDKKEKILESIFGAHTTDLTSAFVRIITSKGREAVLEEVAKHYVELIMKRKGILSAQVVTAVPMGDDTRAAMKQMVERLNPQGTVAIEEVVNPDIVGGFVLKVEDQMIDASVLSQLRKLHREFDDNSYEASL
jgi:F-type H+-transporting ATPase subunit delta